MKEIKEKIISQINKSTKIALCSDTIDTVDKAYTLAALAKFLQQQKKEVAIILADQPSEEFSKFLQNQNLSYETEAKPLSYVISIDYGASGLDKVTYDTDEQKGLLKFYIVPSAGTFDFENVEYTTEGKSYDLTITVGIKSFKEMKNVYEKSDYLFKDNKVISLIKGIDSLGDLYWKAEADESLLIALYNVVRGDISQEIMDFILEGVIAMDTILEGGANNSTWGAISMLAQEGASVDKALRKSYFSKTYPNLDLQIKLMHNIKVAKDVGVIWSTVSTEDMKFCGVNEESLDLKGRIPFNVSKDFDLAIAAYEVKKDSVTVLVESNNPEKYSASKIAGVFSGTGNDSHAQFSIEDIPIKDFSKRFFMVLSDMYDTNVENGKGVEFRAPNGN